MIINIGDVAEYIQNRLMEEDGVLVKLDDIIKILDIELDYLIDLGLAEVVEE